MIEVCASIVRRDDPHLYATALFAPEPSRSRMMVLYAFDCELSRAVRVSKESMIPRMRLQWWRDVLVRAQTDDAAPAHEVAGPLTGLIRSDPCMLSDMAEFPGRDVLSQMIDGYEMELDAPFSAEQFRQWTSLRFGARLALAGSILPAAEDQGRAADDSAASIALGLGLALRTAARMASAQGRTLLPDVSGQALAALSRGQLEGDLGGRLAALARKGLSELSALRKARWGLSGTALAAHLPVLREARVLRRVARDPRCIFGKIDDVDRPFAGLRLAFAALRRRW